MRVDSLPVAGAPGDVGIVFNFYSRPERDQKRRYGVAGHSFISVVDFGPQVEARSILVFGENSNPELEALFRSVAALCQAGIQARVFRFGRNQIAR